MGKYGPEKTANLNIFHAVIYSTNPDSHHIETLHLTFMYFQCRYQMVWVSQFSKNIRFF